MKTLKLKTPSSVISTFAAGALLLCAFNAHAVNYAGNGNTSFGGDIGNGVLTLTDDGTNINGTLTCGQGDNMYNTLVIYVDTGAGGGFASTANFSDTGGGGDALRIAISGYSSQGRSTLTFTNGFAPQYAIALGPNTASYGGVWQLANGGDNSLIFLTSANLSPLGTTAGPFTFSFPATALGLTNGIPATIKLLGTYISNSGYRSSEAVGGNVYGSFGAGWNPYVQTAFASYNFAATSIPSQPVNFLVDMTVPLASGAFNPANGDVLYAAGSFQTNPWTGFQLTPSDGNTNIYVGTYQDQNPTNTVEQYKFFYNSVSGGNQVYESLDNRPFTLQSGGQILPLVYFDDVFPTPSATTNVLSFSIDMTVQIELGHFNPANGDQIEVLGTLENPKWTVGGFILTNNPNITASNVYSGTIADGNYPGSFEEYKFVIISGGSPTYESINNRAFFTPTNAYTFPLAYFNNITSAYSIPVTFQVDMTVPLLAGSFNPNNGDTVSAAGTFQSTQWTPDVFFLTNNPTGPNPNIFTGIYIDQNAPGTGEQFKFQINSGGTTTWEGVNNRTFTLASSAQTLPVVTWNNEDSNSVLLQATAVTFTVNMTNAVDEYGAPFDPNNDLVVIAGTFTNPQWTLNWQDPAINSDYGQYVLQNNPVGSLLYSGTYTVPAGNSYQVIYKYGIYHNTAQLNTNADNEAAANVNHTRYIRTVGAYNFPVDIFGIQRTNAAAATEMAFGNLTIGAPVAGQLPIAWLGLPGVHLQVSTNLLQGGWQDLNATTGASSTNWPAASGTGFFRLIQP
jgi:hypothetical protein